MRSNRSGSLPKAADRLTEFSRARPMEVAADHEIEVRIESSVAAGRRLISALEAGTRDFVLTSRDGSVSTVIRLRLANASVTEHRVAGCHVIIDWNVATVQCRLDRVTLSRTELHLLAALLATPGRAIERQDLIARVWPLEDDADRENALAVYVCTLRKKLAGIGLASALRTVRGVGYQIVE